MLEFFDDIINDIISILHLIGLGATFLAFLSWILATSYAHIVISHQHSNFEENDNIKRNDQANQMRQLAASHAANILGKNNNDKSPPRNSKNNNSNNNNNNDKSNSKNDNEISSPTGSEASSYSVASSGIGITPIVTPMASPATPNPATSTSIPSPKPLSSSELSTKVKNITPINLNNLSEMNKNDKNDKLTNTEQNLLNSLVENPDALVGWRIRVKEHGIGLVRRVVRLKFRTTRYDIVFTNGQTKLLKLRRVSRDGAIIKGNIAFELVDKKN